MEVGKTYKFTERQKSPASADKTPETFVGEVLYTWTEINDEYGPELEEYFAKVSVKDENRELIMFNENEFNNDDNDLSSTRRPRVIRITKKVEENAAHRLFYKSFNFLEVSAGGGSKQKRKKSKKRKSKKRKSKKRKSKKKSSKEKSSKKRR